jgi:hypothetical protein
MGSLLLDRRRKAYCALSPRADEELLLSFVKILTLHQLYLKHSNGKW